MSTTVLLHNYRYTTDTREQSLLMRADILSAPSSASSSQAADPSSQARVRSAEWPTSASRRRLALHRHRHRPLPHMRETPPALAVIFLSQTLPIRSAYSFSAPSTPISATGLMDAPYVHSRIHAPCYPQLHTKYPISRVESGRPVL